MPVAIPDALFKLVARKSDKVDSQYEVLGFVFPQDSPYYAERYWESSRWRASVARIELLAGHKLVSPAISFSELSVTELWRQRREDFEPGCLRFAP